MWPKQTFPLFSCFLSSVWSQQEESQYTSRCQTTMTWHWGWVRRAARCCLPPWIYRRQEHTVYSVRRMSWKKDRWGSHGGKKWTYRSKNIKRGNKWEPQRNLLFTVIYSQFANKINLGKQEAVMQKVVSFSMIRIIFSGLEHNMRLPQKWRIHFEHQSSDFQ